MSVVQPILPCRPTPVGDWVAYCRNLAPGRLVKLPSKRRAGRSPIREAATLLRELV